MFHKVFYGGMMLLNGVFGDILVWVTQLTSGCLSRQLDSTAQIFLSTSSASFWCKSVSYTAGWYGNRRSDSLLWEHFVPMDVESIFWIHLPSTPRADEVLRHFMKDGIYNVKSGYLMSLAWDNMDVAKSSSSSSRDRNKIWHLNVPWKAKFFLWQGYIVVVHLIDN